jgi:hypothetical protein
VVEKAATVERPSVQYSICFGDGRFYIAIAQGTQPDEAGYACIGCAMCHDMVIEIDRGDEGFPEWQ